MAPRAHFQRLGGGRKRAGDQGFRLCGGGGDEELFVATNSLHGAVGFAREEACAISGDDQGYAAGHAVDLFEVGVREKDFAAGPDDVDADGFDAERARVAGLGCADGGGDAGLLPLEAAEEVASVMRADALRADVVDDVGGEFDLDSAFRGGPTAIENGSHGYLGIVGRGGENSQVQWDSITLRRESLTWPDRTMAMASL